MTSNESPTAISEKPSKVKLRVSSQLLLENVAALPGAYVELTGSSLTIVNMMPDGTLTGFGTGSSHLSYYGSSSSLDYSTSDSATVTSIRKSSPC